MWAVVSLLAAMVLGTLLAASVRNSKQVSPAAGPLLGEENLTSDRLDRVILHLEETARRAKGKAEALSDLSAALLVRAKVESRPLDLLRALDAVNRALAESPRLPEALFNRAKTLAQLHLRGQARKAWQAYLNVDARSAWAEEADEGLKAASEPTLEEQWIGQLPRLQEAVRKRRTQAVREIVTHFPQRARLYAEEKMLPAWGSSFERGEFQQATDSLAVAREIGDALLAVTHDAMIADSVAAIDRMHAKESADQRSLMAVGHSSYGKGMELYRERQELQKARPLLASAAQLLNQTGSPFAGWADFYLAVCSHYGEPAGTGKDFQSLQHRTPNARYPVLSGVVTWMRGTLEHNGGRPESALAFFRTAYNRLDGASHEESAFVHVLIAEAYKSLGEVEEGWRERLAALEGISRSGDRRKMHPALYEAASALLVEGNPTLAPDFLAELLDSDQSFGNHGMLAETYLLRGRALYLLGRSSESLADFRAAQNQALAMAASAQQERIASMLSLAEGETLIADDPDQAVRTLSAALASDLRQGFQYQRAPILVARARAYEAKGDFRQAEMDLRQALKEHEAARKAVRDEQLRLSYFERAQTAFNEMIQLQMDLLGNPIRALDFAEKSRARVLLDLTLEHESIRLPAALTGEGLKARLPQGVTLVEYAVLPDRLLAWVVERSAIHPVSVPITESALEQKVEGLRSAVDRRAGEKEFRESATALYDLLIQPLASYLPVGGRLVFIPDRSLVQVPFAALYDPAHRRYLAQAWSVSIAPSASLYIAATAELRRFERARDWNALIVGDPAFDLKHHLTLVRLPKAAVEAAEIAALYKQSHLLESAAATRKTFLMNAGEYRLIHFAGHALLHPTSPRLSHLLFAPDDESSSGALYASEVAALRLAKTEIVVLSACRAVADNRGSREGLTGLAAAFLAAGSPVVVSSLWNVDDASARELMRSFHHALHGGKDPGDALRSAQLALLASSDEKLRSPTNWAGFEVIGGAYFVRQR